MYLGPEEGRHNKNRDENGLPSCYLYEVGEQLSSLILNHIYLLRGGQRGESEREREKSRDTIQIDREREKMRGGDGGDVGEGAPACPPVCCR